MNLKKLVALVLSVAMVSSTFVGCVNSGTSSSESTKDSQNVANNTGDSQQESQEETDAISEPEAEGYVSELDADGKYVRGDDDEIYDSVLGEFAKLSEKARNSTDSDERFVLYAQAEAALLDSAVMMPNTTRGGTYTISRIVPRTQTNVMWGNDSDRLHTMLVLKDSFITPKERDELLEMWNKAIAGEGSYDPKAYLTEKGHTFTDEYNYTFSTAPVTLDWLNTSSQSDTEVTVNTVTGLVEYDNMLVLQPALAESWEISEDQTTYTFHLRKDAKWFTAEGTEYAPVTAHDFVAGFQHMLDARAGLEGLAGAGGAEIVGVDAYVKEGASFEGVGYKAQDDYTLVITTSKPVPYFMTMLTYSIFLPICKSFYEAHGGVYGHEEYEAAVQDTAKYTFGSNTDVASQVYCGPYLLQKLQPDSEILLVKNDKYFDAASTTFKTIKAVYDSGENPKALYQDVVNGVYAGMGLGQASGTLELAKKDGNFDKFAYISETNATTYFAGLNVNRGTFALASGACTSSKSEQQKAETVTALNNKNFRKAMLHAFDKKTMNAASVGEDLAEASLRNMYTAPEFVKLQKDYTDEDGHTFTAGTFYGEMVQYYCDQIGCKINCKDGVDGWHNAALAKEYLEKAKKDLEGKVSFPVQIDVVYYSVSDGNTAMANAYKTFMEETLGKENVVINLIEATTTDDFYACGYRAANGEAGNFDIFWGSGWGPDYGDPCTYLNTFDNAVDGYMLKVEGLY